MGFEGWLLLLTRAAIITASGEIAIRYASWWFVVRGRGIMLAPALIGIAIAAASICLYEYQILLIKIADQGRRPELLMGYHFAEATRICEFFSACFLTYPVTKLQYNHSLERALTEMCVRVFIMVTVAAVTWEIATLHFVAHAF